MRNSKKFSTKIRLLVLPLFFSLCGFSSCSRTLELVCTKDIPHFLDELRIAEYKVEHKADALAPEVQSQGRGLASSPSLPHWDMSMDEKDEWQSWTEKQLSQARDFLAFAENQDFSPVEIEKIHHLTNELVVFWGFVAKGKTSAFSHSLKVIEFQSHEIQSSLCTHTVAQLHFPR